MSNQPENEEYSNKSSKIPLTASNISSKSQNQSSNQTSMNTSTIKFASEAKDKNHAAVVVQPVNISDNQVEINQIDKLINEKRENKKSKTLRKLPAEPVVVSPNTQREIVGDDLNKKNEVHILCECEPGVAGAAVPTVISFNSSSDSNKKNIDSGSSKITKNDSISNSEKTANISRTKHWVSGKKVVKEKDDLKDKAIVRHKNKEIERKVINLENSADEKDRNNNSKEIQSPEESNQSIKSIVEKASTDMKPILKRPSLIPKLSRGNTNSRKGRPFSKEEERRENMSCTPKNIVKCAGANDKIRESKTYKNFPRTMNTKADTQLKVNELGGTNISLKMLSLQERLKATTSMLRQKNDMDTNSCKLLPKQSGSCNLLVEPEVEKPPTIIYKKPIEDLYANVSELKQIASFLSETNTIKTQIKYIEKLYKNISDIKRIADKLRDENDQGQQSSADDQYSDGSLVIEKEKPQKYSTSAKDNKIYIKFMPTREKKQDGKRKKKEGLPEQSEEAQTDLCLGAKLTSESLNSDTYLMEITDEHIIKEADSMDGVFIPTCEPPKNMEEEEETTGLDITITIPEFNQLHSIGTDSHISVCLSEISAEALGKLKRCPKEFTLRMDFVEGKVLFHSGKGLANNPPASPDIKCTENFVDDKKSDVINIKPSTECSFTSQLIPVENAKEANSSKTLKSTDSELFNVVNLPLLYKSPYLNPATGHKSCMSFKNDKIVSLSFIARQLFKSMPQIPSLTNIFEDQIMDSFNKTGQEAEKSTKSEKEN